MINAGTNMDVLNWLRTHKIANEQSGKLDGQVFSKLDMDAHAIER